jgi:2-oxoglutarate ferredoxin oxidoreductase subunit alpha
MARSFGPQIRGGEAAALLRLGTAPVESADDGCQLLIALDWGNIERFADELPLAEDAVVVADPSQGQVPSVIAGQPVRILQVPLAELASSVPGGRASMVALGLAAGFAGLPAHALEHRIVGGLTRHGDELVRAAIECCTSGLREAATLLAASGLEPLPVPPPVTGERWALNGNEATAFGALGAGLRFCAAYPITPATEILEWLAPRLARLGGTLVQAEDELASINMCLGASYGGVPSLTATSGPGLSLMIESLGLAVAAELPVVVIDVMRGGPSTGIPTKSEQTDLNIAVYGLHGEAPHVVVAPTGVADCLDTAAWAMSLAEHLQTPVIMLSDQALGQTRAVIDAPAMPSRTEPARRLATGAGTQGYRRYALTDDGLSPMSLPGMPGLQYTADGLTHAESGMPSTRAADHVAQLEKRRRKLQLHDYGERWAALEGMGPLALITWGSATGPAREACRRAAALGLDVRLIALRLIAPAPAVQLTQALVGVDAALVVEHNQSGQLYRHLRGWTELPALTVPWHRPGPLPLRPAEILEGLLRMHRSLDTAA